MTSPPPVPVDSATIALLREPTPDRVEVLLVARHAESRAFAGAHVFPGGLLDPEDRAPAVLSAMNTVVSPETAAALVGDGPAREPPLAYFAATIRELFEEAGILLADQDGHPLDLADPATRKRFTDHRRALLASQITFGGLVTQERLRLRAADLCYLSRWITPVHAPRRYDARFFVAAAPAGQTPLHDDRETTSADWWSPADALASAAAGTIVLTPPTARTLEELVELGTMAQVLASAARRRVTPILPKVVQIGERMGVLYPGDVDYDATEPGAALPAERSGALNRVVMDDAGWRRFRGERV